MKRKKITVKPKSDFTRNETWSYWSTKKCHSDHFRRPRKLYILQCILTALKVHRQINVKKIVNELRSRKMFEKDRILSFDEFFWWRKNEGVYLAYKYEIKNATPHQFLGEQFFPLWQVMVQKFFPERADRERIIFVLSRNFGEKTSQNCTQCRNFRILHEINFGHIEAPQNCHFDHFSSSVSWFFGKKQKNR